MAANAQLRFGGAIREIGAVGPNVGSTSISWSLIDQVITLSGTTNPAVDDVWARRLALTAGALTLSLVALEAEGMDAKDWTGKNIYGWVIRNLGASEMTFTAAVTNGYPLFGDAAGQVTIPAGGMMQGYIPAGLDAVSATVSDVDIAGTLVEQFDIALIAG